MHRQNEHDQESLESPTTLHERSLIGGVVMAAVSGQYRDILQIIPDLLPDLFYLPKHQELVRAMVDIFQDSEGDVARLGDTGRLYFKLRPGTFDSLEELDSYLLDGGVAADLELAMGAVKESHCRRSLERLVRGLQAQLDNGIPTGRLIESAVNQMTGLVAEENRNTSVITYGDALQQTLAYIRANMEIREQGRSLPAAPSGITALDNALGGGLWPGELVVLAARPGVGKSALGLQWMLNTVERKQQEEPEAWGVVFPMEMSAMELVLRDLAAGSEMDTRDMKGGLISREQLAELEVLAERLASNRRILIHEHVRTITDVIAAAKADVILMGGRPPELLLIDYLGLFDTGESHNLNHATAIGKITRGCKVSLAKGVKTPVLLLCQLNRDVENRGGATVAKARLADLRDSGNIEQDANVVIFINLKTSLEAETKTDETRNVEISIAKKRDGGIADIEAVFNKRKTKFYGVTGERQTDYRQPMPVGIQVRMNGMHHSDFED